MNLIRFALRKPIAIMVVVLAIAVFSYSTISKINVDIFPEVELPAMYIAMPYGGLSPAYMDGFMANEFQKVLLFVGGVKNIDFKSIQGLTLMKLTFYPGTNMSQAAGEVSTSVSRAMGFLPSGAVPPIVVRFDGSSLPVGQLIFESDQRSVNEIQTLVLTRIRPMFVEIPGITAPAPFGGNIRSIVINVDPEAMQANGLSPEEITVAITKSSLPSPAGNIRIGDENLMAPLNSLAKSPEEFLNTPIKTGDNRTVYVRDVASVEDAADQTVGYALINGKRSVYLPIIKKADASTLDAVQNLKSALPMLKNQLPEDVNIRYEFDQSTYIERSLSNLIHEGILGAVFTGLIILLFLGDTRGALIVVLTIPIAVLSAVMVLYLFGQTINIMTLSGLALSIGILVDEATVTIENIHQHMEMRKGKHRAIVDALLEISTPKLLILFCILAVLTPAFVMTGLPRDMFMPLSMAVAFAMIASFLASQTFVPILANWMMKNKHHEVANTPRKRAFFEKFRVNYSYRMRKYSKKSLSLFILYVVVAGGVSALLLTVVGTDVMPVSNSGDFQLRIQAPQGSRLEVTEKLVREITDDIKEQLPENGIIITSAFVGMHPAGSPINAIFLFTNASHEAVLQVSVDQEIYSGSMEDLKEKIRKVIAQNHPESKFNFEPTELTEKIMGQGAMTPIEVKVGAGQVLGAFAHASKIEANLKNVPYLRDVRIVEPVAYPNLEIEVNRDLAGQFGLTMQDITRSIVTATSSTRFTDKNLWVDPKSGLVFQVQVQIPESIMSSEEKLRSLPLKKGSIRPVLEDVATIRRIIAPAQVNRKGPNRYVTVIANVYGKDLGTASRAVKNAIKEAGEPPRGTTVWTEGTLQLLDDTLGSLLAGLGVAIIAIFLMLSAYYQSFKVPLIILAVVPAVFAGSLIILFLTGSTLNLQSYMGIIMSIGVSVSNAVLLVNQAEFYRRNLALKPANAARLAASSRLRPVLMTATAMLAGMLPMAIGLGDGAEQVAPLGRAVIGGLIASTATILLLLPHFFSSLMSKTKNVSPSLDPDDEESKYYLENTIS
ncbi:MULTISPECIES: efflux RND transporter permease subunit [Algoriphagus]|jgi:multidrug efflux pump subunit AcrB|uniref:Efflux RND transporter permease subunit n=2 Tax=Algoriphagus TaxID=246875 RepID=A0A5C7AZY6_9BACT|nr:MULTISPECIES: efflux RND transporter permease subunit [Algoriphagus]MDP2041145.1 efflux RND transporter permease subunit [Algoriphagus sp.]MDP3471703.1 efflux RND transporter permease subunit [Algoriphagus sp.]TXE14091.1 efflux RND transporter permease subunit [Algoriphagus aquimarinus]SEF73200.1 Multidrug efflux pump subunit AcrB [Algoriphagus boritolerans DSM 17298 = JCM 18970]